MHTPISKQVLTRNSEPQYVDPIIESCISCEDEALSHIDMKPDNSKLVANIFGFIPKSPTPTEAHQLIKDTKMPNYMKCYIPVQSGLNIKAWRAHSNYVTYWNSVFLLTLIGTLL